MKTLARILLAVVTVSAPIAWSSAADAATIAPSGAVHNPTATVSHRPAPPAPRTGTHYTPANDPTYYISEHTLEMTGLVSTTCVDYGTWPNPLSAASQRWVRGFCTGHGSTFFVRTLGYCFREVAHDAGVGVPPSQHCVNVVNRYAYRVPSLGVAQFTAVVHAPQDVLAQNLMPQVFPVTYVTSNGRTYL